MNARVLKLGVPAALVLALSACAANPEKVEDPHHYSKDRDGNRVACYATDITNQYECEPLVQRYPRGYPYPGHAYDPFWDPWWSYGFGYQWWDWNTRHIIYYPYPVDRHPRRHRR